MKPSTIHLRLKSQANVNLCAVIVLWFIGVGGVGLGLGLGLGLGIGLVGKLMNCGIVLFFPDILFTVACIPQDSETKPSIKLFYGTR